MKLTPEQISNPTEKQDFIPSVTSNVDAQKLTTEQFSIEKIRERDL